MLLYIPKVSTHDDTKNSKSVPQNYLLCNFGFVVNIRITFRGLMARMNAKILYLLEKMTTMMTMMIFHIRNNL